MKTPLLLWLVGVGALLISAPSAWAHGAHSITPDVRWWQLWSADPLILINLTTLSVLYVYGLRQLRAQRQAHMPVRPRQVVAFAVAIASLVIALLSPVDVLAGELLWVHMVQHMILMNVAAPLFVLGAPVRVMLWALPAKDRQTIGRFKRAAGKHGIPRYVLWQPIALWVVYALVLWIWHLPTLYEAALRYNVVHDLQHLIFFAVSSLFWRVLFDPIGRLRMTRATAVFYLFLTSLHATVLGVFMALAPTLWYPTYAGRTEPWGLIALEDQQLAGYIMWMPGCMVYAAVAAVLFSSWLKEEA